MGKFPSLIAEAFTFDDLVKAVVGTLRDPRIEKDGAAGLGCDEPLRRLDWNVFLRAARKAPFLRNAPHSFGRYRGCFWLAFWFKATEVEVVFDR